MGNQAGANNIGADPSIDPVSGNWNTFVGSFAGQGNINGSNNTFVGYNAGRENAGGFFNCFFGSSAGQHTKTFGDSFFGNDAGEVNTSGAANSFFGSFAGQSNTAGNHDTFIAYSSGIYNVTADNNTFVGYQAGPPNGTGNLMFAAAVGANAKVTTSHTIVLGTDQEVVDIPGKLQIDTLGTSGSQQLCLNGSNRVAPCSSSLRYKSGIQRFSGGLEIVHRLNPSLSPGKMAVGSI